MYKANVTCTRPKSRVENAFLALKTENIEVQARGGGNLAVECLLASPSEVLLQRHRINLRQSMRSSCMKSLNQVNAS